MRISIALATYNGAEYLSGQLQSFIDQTRQPDELVVSDDGSTDSTLDIIEDFARTAPFEVRLFRNKQNLGYAGNFNAALTETSGDLIFLSDQDDVWFSEKVEALTALAEKHPEKLLFMNDAALTDAALNEVGLTKLGQILSAGVSEQCFIMGCCCAVRRELLDLCMPIPEGCKAHDNWICAFAEGLGTKLISGQVLQYYRRHGNNESQFIANSLTRVTQWGRYKRLLAEALKRTSEDIALGGALFQKKLILDGITRALSRDSGVYTSQLHTMASETLTEVDLMEKRMDIRRRRFLGRLAASLSYWRKGGYQRARGLQSVIRDVLL